MNTTVQNDDLRAWLRCVECGFAEFDAFPSRFIFNHRRNAVMVACPECKTLASASASEVQ